MARVGVLLWTDWVGKGDSVGWGEWVDGMLGSGIVVLGGSGV